MLKYNYIIERDRYVVWFWKISLNFNINEFGDHDMIEIIRTNHYERHMGILITKKLIIFSTPKHKETYFHNIDLSNQLVNVSIISKPDKSCLVINDNVFDLPNLLCTGKLCEINSTIPIDNYKIEYPNFKSDIPRVYGDCFTNVHTHEMFGKYLLEQGANYYCVNYPSVIDPMIILDLIREDIKRCFPIVPVYVFMKSHLIKDFYKYYKEFVKEYPNIDFITCTMPHMQSETNKIYNDNIRGSELKYIDFAKDFDELQDRSIYFKDAAHINKEGAKILYERIKKNAPDLTKHYELDI